jgi:hypothetical protein
MAMRNAIYSTVYFGFPALHEGMMTDLDHPIIPLDTVLSTVYSMLGVLGCMDMLLRIDQTYSQLSLGGISSRYKYLW